MLRQCLQVCWVAAILVAAQGLEAERSLAADASKEEAEVRKALDRLNVAFTKNDKESLKQLMAADHIAITPYYGGPFSNAEQIKSLPDLKLSEYKTGPKKFIWISKDVVLISYAVSQKGTFKGKELAPKGYVAAVWVNRDGKWMEASYQETALSGK
jgi:hypothetical protein